MDRRRKTLKLLCLSGLLLLLGGCKAVVLDPKGWVAKQELHLLITAVLLMLIIVVPVLVLVLVISRRYRASNKKAKYTPDWAHSNTLEAIWWAIPCAIIVVLATITWKTTHKLDPYKELAVGGKPLTIEVVALQWRWLFIYPEQNIATINHIEFPANRQVKFLITADAPMNSFQIPQLAGQIYAMAGMQTKLHVIADEAGTYQGRSVSFSGDGFSDMKFTVKATSDDAFNQWVQSVKGSQNVLTKQAYQQLAKPTKNEGIEYFASVDSNLYHDIIMSYKMPSKQPLAVNASANATQITN